MAEAKLSTNTRPGDALAGDVDVVGTELADHGAADGVTDQHDTSQVQCLEHGHEVGGGLVRTDALGPDRRAAVTAQVVGDDAELVGQVDELVPPQVVAERQSVNQDERRPGAALTHVQLGPVTCADRGGGERRRRSAQLADGRAPLIAPPHEPRDAEPRVQDPR